ncbi:MAG: hypothetical protein KDI11_05015 [Alphaproteobacteria bacterium]|nr:hypothetical protein [Alphaproteobacteria bacterium]
MTDTATAAYLSLKLYDDLEIGAFLDTSARYEVVAIRNEPTNGYYGAVMRSCAKLF